MTAQDSHTETQRRVVINASFKVPDEIADAPDEKIRDAAYDEVEAFLTAEDPEIEVSVEEADR